MTTSTAPNPMSQESEIQVIDLQPFFDGSLVEKQRVADAILASFQSIGFVQVLNHGVPQADLDTMFEWVSKASGCLVQALKILSHSPRSFSRKI